MPPANDSCSAGRDMRDPVIDCVCKILAEVAMGTGRTYVVGTKQERKKARIDTEKDKGVGIY
jgi:hypothetical protein